jgi:hypothetical protein
MLPLFLLPLLLLSSPSLLPGQGYSAQSDFLLAEFQVELVPAVKEERSGDEDPLLEAPGEILPLQARPLARDEAVRRLLEEAQFVFSGMIYGYHLCYTPSDSARQVEELFTAEPVAVIPWGDPSLRVLDTWRKDDMFYARIRYNLDADQMRRLDSWSSAIHKSAQGSGEAPLSLGYRGRMEAHRLAVKEAFREHLRSVKRNKPRAAEGRAVLADPPFCSISAGGYRSSVRIRLQVEEIHPYGSY